MATFEKIIVSPTSPSTPSAIWLNSEDGKLYAPMGAKWTEVSSDTNTVETVDTLPEITEENKTKIFKLKDEANLYAPTLIKSTTTYTNRLPDEQQIDKAYLFETKEDIYYYKGAYKVICSDGEMSGYLWGEYIVSLKNAETATQDSGTIYYVADGGVFDNVNKTITFDTDLASFKSENGDAGGFMAAGVTLVCATYNAPESAQIGNAVFYGKDDNELLTAIYVGDEITFINPDTQEEVIGYKWYDTPNDFTIVSTNKASEIIFYNDSGTYYSDTNFWIYDEPTEETFTCDLDSLSIPQLNAPDSEQVDTAYIIEDVDNPEYGYTYYTGEETTIEVGGSTTTVYEWHQRNGEGVPMFSTKPANEIYNTDRDSEDVKFYAGEDMSDIYEISFSEETLLSISTVKYQRTEHTEQWDYVSAFPVIEKRVLMKYMADSGTYMNLPTEGFVNVNGETMEYRGKTYYKWICIEETEAGKSRNRDVLDENQTVLSGQIMILLTTSLDPNLPFSPESPEWAYLISSEDVEDIYNAQNDPIAQEAYIDKFGNMTVRT